MLILRLKDHLYIRISLLIALDKTVIHKWPSQFKVLKWKCINISISLTAIFSVCNIAYYLWGFPDFPKTGDWVKLAKMDLKSIGINFSFEQIATFSKFQFKRMVKNLCKKQAFQFLMKEKENQRKGENFCYPVWEFKTTRDLEMDWPLPSFAYIYEANISRSYLFSRFDPLLLVQLFVEVGRLCLLRLHLVVYCIQQSGDLPQVYLVPTFNVFWGRHPVLLTSLAYMYEANISSSYLFSQSKDFLNVNRHILLLT